MIYILSTFMEKRNTLGIITYPAWIASVIKTKYNIPVKLCSAGNFLNVFQKTKTEKNLVHFRAYYAKDVQKYSNMENNGAILVNTSEYIHITNNKLYAQKVAIAGGIKTAVNYDKIFLNDGNPTSNRYRIEGIMQQLDTDDIVIKPNYSSGNGSNVWRLKKKELDDFDFNRLTYVDQWTIQKTLKYSRIIRCIVHGGKVVAEAVTWDAPLPGGWKCTVCINPYVKHEKNVDPELIKFVENIAKVTGAGKIGICYIDVYETDDGYVYGESNCSCTLEQHEKVTGTPIHELTADYLVSLYK